MSIKISELSSASALAATDEFEIASAGVSKKITMPFTKDASENMTQRASHILYQGVDVASAAALTLGVGNNFDVTGTTAITSIATKGVGSVVILQFDGILTFTHHATNLILPGGANITTAAGDIAVLWEYGTGTWRCVSYSKADGTALFGSSISSGTETATTSGTSIDFTSIPSGTKRITVMFNLVSTTGTSLPMLQIGDSGGIEATGYTSVATNVSSAVTSTSFTTGAGLAQAWAGTSTLSGTVTLTLLGSNIWTFNGAMALDGSAQQYLMSGQKTLTATLDRIRLTTVGGTDTFDAGSINILYE